MALETGTYLDDLVISNPAGTDSKSQGDDHLRLIKTVLKNTFPRAVGALKFQRDDETAAFSHVLTMYKKTSTATKDDYIAGISFNCNDSVDVERVYARVLTQIVDPLSTSIDGQLIIQTVENNSLVNKMICNPSGVTIDSTVFATIAQINDIRMPGTSVIRWTGADANNDTYIQGFNVAGIGPTLHFVINATEMWRAQTGLVLYGKTAANMTDPGITLYSSVAANTGRIDVVGKNAQGLQVGRVAGGPAPAVNYGNLQLFYRDSTYVGGFSVDSASTLKLNAFLGTHWSQLADNTEPALYQGTVVECLDQFCHWDGEEAETRLVCFKVSDTADSPMVYGTFHEWDSSDELHDAYISVTGLGWVRMQAGSVVVRGDLVSSNGNGCAKKQGGTSVTSATIGKIVSATKVETYPDGSYRVPISLLCG